MRNLSFSDEFIIVTNESYKEIMESQLKAFQGLRCRIIYESKNCGTFAAVSLASAFLNASDIMMVTVSDIIIEYGSYKDFVIKTDEIAKNGAIANIVKDISNDNVDNHAEIYVCMVGDFNHSLQKIFPGVSQFKKKVRHRLGTFAGMYFGEFIEKCGEEVVGWKSSSLDRFTVLIKFIDAKNAFSIKIHPDDDYALENENEFEKNEIWYVVDCK